MSYSFSAPITKSAGTADVSDLRDSGAKHLEEINFESAEHKAATAEHIEAACDAVAELVKTIGRDDETLIVSVSGHANPGHGPADGWSDETVSIGVSVHRTE